MNLLLYPQGDISGYSLDRRLGGPHSCSVHYGEKINLLLLLEIEPIF
jgi:hypothetical protein